MHFWSGTEIKTEEITNVKAYNRAKGIMWIAHGSSYIFADILGLAFGGVVGTVILVLSGTLGLLFLIMVYKHIYKKYHRSQVVPPHNSGI